MRQINVGNIRPDKLGRLTAGSLVAAAAISGSAGAVSGVFLGLQLFNDSTDVMSVKFIALAAWFATTVIAAIILARLAVRQATLDTVRNIAEDSGDGRFLTQIDGSYIYSNVEFGNLLPDFDPSGQTGFDEYFAGQPDNLHKIESLRRHVSKLAASSFGKNSDWVAGGELHINPIDTADSDTGAPNTLPVSEKDEKWLALCARHIPGRGAGLIDWRLIDRTSDHRWRIQIEQHRQRLADYVDDAPVGFFSVDADGQFQFSNNTFAGWLGTTPQALVNNHRIDEFLVADQVAADQIEEPDVGLLMRTLEGIIFPVEITQTILRDEEGAILRRRGVVRDLRSERAMARNLSEMEQRMGFLFESAPFGVAILNHQGSIVDANAAFAKIADAENQESVVGRPIDRFITIDDGGDQNSKPGSIIAACREVRSYRRPIDVRFSLGLSQGSERVGQLFISRQIDNDQRDQQWMIFLIDYTDQHNLEIQFAQSQKMQAVGQLAGGIAHDFNNLLTAIIGFSDLLLLRHSAGDESFGDIMQVKQNANRAANLVRQLLAFSRKQTLRPQILDITDVLAELSNLIRRLVGERIELRLRHGRDLGPIMVDQGQFEQVIINLAVNARDAMPGGGVLTIRTSDVTPEDSEKSGYPHVEPDHYVLIEVSDTGTGIPEEHIEKLFEPFFTTKDVGEGTGLGLSTVYGIVKQTGGYVYAHNEQGGGALFRILLPCHVGETTASKVEDEPEGAEAVKDLTGMGTILLVEDEDTVRLFAARALRSKGYTILEADSGESALEVLQEHGGKIDLLISDVVMPQMDGPTLLANVRDLYGDVKVILISGYAEEVFDENLGDDIKFSFLPKPFSLDQLATTVKQVLSAA